MPYPSGSSGSGGGGGSSGSPTTYSAPYGLKSIAAEYSYATGWTAQVVYCLPHTQVGAFIENMYLSEFAASTYMAVVKITDEPWPIEDVVGSDGFSQSRKVTLYYAIVYLDVPWPTNTTKPAHATGTTLKLHTHYATEHLPLDGRSVRNLTGPSIYEKDLHETLLISMTEYDIEWDRVEDVGDLDFDGLIGYVNTDSFLGQPAGTLWCTGADQSPSFVLDPVHAPSWRTVVHIRKRCINVVGGTQDGKQFGWNDHYNDKMQVWEKFHLTNGQTRFPTTAFAGMFS